MVFSSTIFLFLFLPILLGVYFLSPIRFRNLLLLVSSLFFYAWGEGLFVIVMLTSIGVNYACARLIASFSGRRAAGAVMAGAIIINLALLIVFKYLNFIVANANAVLAWLGMEPFVHSHARGGSFTWEPDVMIRSGEDHSRIIVIIELAERMLLDPPPIRPLEPSSRQLARRDVGR